MDFHLYNGTGDMWFRELESSAYPSYRYVSGREANRSKGKATFRWSATSGHYSGYPDYPDFFQLLDKDGLERDGFYYDHPDYDRDDPATHPRWRATDHWKEVTELDMFRVASINMYHDCAQHLGFQDELVQFMELLWSGMTSLAGVAGQSELATRKAEADKLQQGFADIYQQLDRATTERDVLIALSPYLHELEWSQGWHYSGSVLGNLSAQWIMSNYVRPLTDYITAQATDHDAHVTLRSKWTKGYIVHPRFLEFSEFGKVFKGGSYNHHQWNTEFIEKIAKSIDDLSVPTVPDLDEDDSTESGE